MPFHINAITITHPEVDDFDNFHVDVPLPSNILLPDSVFHLFMWCLLMSRTALAKSVWGYTLVSLVLFTILTFLMQVRYRLQTHFEAFLGYILELNLLSQGPCGCGIGCFNLVNSHECPARCQRKRLLH